LFHGQLCAGLRLYGTKYLRRAADSGAGPDRDSEWRGLWRERNMRQQLLLHRHEYLWCLCYAWMFDL
jgi:hypothetical protein